MENVWKLTSIPLVVLHGVVFRYKEKVTVYWLHAKWRTNWVLSY